MQKKQRTRTRHRNTWRHVFAVTACVLTLGWMTTSAAQDVDDGTLAAAIRASGHACSHVIDKEPAGEGGSAWNVRCNSGRFRVTMSDSGNPQVTPIE